MTQDDPPRTKYLSGPNLRKWRNERDLTQEALANAIGTTQGRVAHWENKDDGCELGTIAALATELRCDMTDLMHEKGIQAFRQLAEAVSRNPA